MEQNNVNRSANNNVNPVNTNRININETRESLIKQINNLEKDEKYIKNKQKIKIENIKLDKLKNKVRDLDRDVKYHEALIDNLKKVLSQLGG